MSIHYTTRKFVIGEDGTEDEMEANFTTHWFIDALDMKCGRCGAIPTGYRSKWPCGFDTPKEYQAGSDAEAMSYANVHGVKVRSMQSGNTFG